MILWTWKQAKVKHKYIGNIPSLSVYHHYFDEDLCSLYNNT